MAMLAILLFAFGLVHVVPSLPGVKSRLLAMFGKTYGAAYGIVSTLLLVGIIWSFRVADATPLYDPPDWGRFANFGLSLLGFICFGIFLFRGSWRNVLRYPMAIGVVLWATGHLLANGDDRTTLLFAGLAGFAVLHAVFKASAGPFVPSDERAGHNLLSVLGGIAIYGVMTQLHYAVTGMPLVQLN